jgi:hypothetical protein
MGFEPSMVNRSLAAIRLMHFGAKHPSPHDALKVAEVMRGIRRAWKKPRRRRRPAWTSRSTVWLTRWNRRR